MVTAIIQLHSLPPHFWSKVQKSADPNGCWLWMASVNEHGYGKFNINRKMLKAHRLSFLDAGGILTEDAPLVLHKCHEFGIPDNPRCVRPSHLKAGNLSENQQDSVETRTHSEAKKTHCPNGHPLTDDNLDAWCLGQGFRKCKTCRNKRQCLRQKAGKR